LVKPIRTSHAVPSDRCAIEAFQTLPADRHNPGAFGSEQPFMPVSSEKIDPGITEIDRKNPKALDGIEKKQGTGPVNVRDERLKIEPSARGKSHPTRCDDLCSRVNRIEDSASIDTAVRMSRDDSQFNPFPRLISPWQDVRGEFICRDHDVIALPPSKTLCDQVDSIGSIRNQGDLFMSGTEQFGKITA
jgi:hypothetical protein